MSQPATSESAAPPRPLFANAVMSFLGAGWSAALALATVPIYLKLLGEEAFGLIGFGLTLQAIVRALDLGLTPAVVRQTARAAATDEGRRTLPDLVRTFEVVFAGLALVAATSLALASGGIASHWIRNQSIPTETVARCVLLMGLQCGVGWLASYYQAILQGLERQVALNALRIAEATATATAGVATIWATRDVAGYFLAQLAVTSLGAGAYAWAAHRALPFPSRGARFRADQVRTASGLLTGMSAVMLSGLVLANMDRLFVSMLAPLDEFGRYSIAALMMTTAAAVLSMPIYHVMLPRLASLSAGAESAAVEGNYRLTLQAIAAIVLPASWTLSQFGADFVTVWTGNADLGASARPLLPWLAASMAINQTMLPCYLLMLSHGWTRFPVFFYAGLVVAFVPLTYGLTATWGASGAAIAMFAMNATYAIVGMPATHGRFLRAPLAQVLARDLGPPAAVVALAALAVWAAPLGGFGPLARIAFGAVAFALACAAATLVSDRLRGEIVGRFRPRAQPVATGRIP